MKKLLLVASAALSALAGSTASADGLRADWMAGKRGMMVHWLFAEAGLIDYYANGFDINKFMADFDATKSDYLIFTIGQNKGTYASPNAKLAELGIPSGCCATRDLVGEIAAAVHARGKKFIAYLPCEVNQNDTVKDLLSWSDRATFQQNYCAVITEWATRWGTNLDGWWIDGFYNDDGHWASSKGFDQSAWATALRAGNPNAVVTLNPGLNAQTPRSDVLSDGVLTDYLAGEINSPSAINWTLKEFADDATCRTHFLMPIDGCWGAYWPWSMAGGANPYSGTPDQSEMNRLSYVGQFPDPVVSESDLSTMIQNVFAVHGAVTINVGVNASGTLNPASVALLAKMPGGSESASAPKGTTVESLIGSWSSTPMASDGSTFSTDGDLVYAYSTASADKTVNGITFKAAADPASASADFEFAPAFNTTQNAESDTMSGDLETIAKLAWKNSEKTTGGYATMTFKGLTAGKRYCIQLYIHDTWCHNSAVFGPDAKSTVIYRSEESDPKSGKDWTCGGVFTGVITAKGTTHEITLYYPTTDRVELNALQVRCLGDEIVRPEDAPVAEESVIDAMAWDALFPTAKTFADTENSFDLPYRQHSPATADGVKYPLVIFLHGAGEIGTDNEKQVKTANDVIPITKYAMKHGDAFVLAPQCPGADGNDYSMTWSGANWNVRPMTRLETPTKPMAAVIKLVTDFMANNPVDPTRVYVTGLSMGGFGTWDLASRMTTTFAAVMPCCGGADPNAAELYRGQSIRFFHGSSDNVVSPDFSRGMDTALTTAGIEHDYIEYSGVNHVDCWRKAYVDTDLNLEWLFGHIKGEEYVAPDHGDTTENAPLSTVANGGWLGWKLDKNESFIVNRGTKVWAYAQNYSCVQGRFGANLVVNEVEFTKSGGFASDDTGIKNHITCDKTFGYGRDNFGVEDLSDGTSDFARMIKTGWEATGDQGPAQTYTLHGLTSGKMYLVQFIYHCASTDRAMLSVIAPGGTVSTRVNGWDANGQNLDENWRYGGSLVGVFTASGSDQTLVITYSKTANYILNAVQLREVTVADLTDGPAIEYGTPTIGSVTPSVNGTTATLTLANVAVGQNGGCYQVWLAYAEDGTALGNETAALISQQSASCAVEIKNLTAGKKYNYSLYVKNEGNVISEKKTGSFTVSGGGSDPVDPPSGDGNWTATPMDAAGEAFSREGDPVFAFMRDRGDPHETTYKEMVSGLCFNWINLPTDTVTKNHATGEAMNGVDNKGHDPADFMSMSPAFNNATDKCGDGGLTDGDDGFAGMLKRAWTGNTLDNIGDDAGQATLTLNNLTADRKYCLQIFVHEDSPNKLKGIKAPDGTIAYAGNFGSVTDCPRGSVLTCTFTATGATESFDLVYLDRGSYQMNAIQLRDLGEAGDDPEPQGETIATKAAKLGVGRWLAMPLTGNPADIITEGTLFVMSNNNKKLSGAKIPGTVNGVVFGGSWSGDGGMTSSPEVSNGKNNCTDCNVSDTAYNNILKNAFTGKSAAEHQVFTFANLTPNATYLVQYICHGQSEFPRSATVTDAQGTHSIEVSAATSGDEWYYGGTLIHVFKANSAGAYELTIDFRDSKGAVDALVNAFQVRAVERSEEPEPVDPPSGEDGWTAKPMSADLHEFVTDGTVVWAKAAPSGDPGFAHVANGIDFMESQISDLASVVTVDPAFSDTKDKCGWEGLGADKDKAGTFMGRAWVREGASNGGVMTMTVGNLTIGHRYCLQLMIHNDGDPQGGFNPGLDLDTMTAPDGETTINYGGTGWQYGGTLIGTFVADAATKSFTFTHSRQNYFQLNAIQLRDLGEAGDDPEPVEADPDTSWMAGSFGVSFHWTAKIVDNYGSKNWEQAVDNFSVKNFADSVESFGAQHVIFTVAHAWQQLPCPCAALDSYITGRTTTRDLMKDIIDEFTNRNIRVIFYYNHSCNHNEDSAWQAASGYNDITDEASMAAFGAKICSIVRELSLRYGDGVSAWWFDSATSVDDSEPWPNTKNSNYVAGLRFPWDNLFAAARAGNPHAAVAVNWDVGATNQHGLATDYLSGETEKIDAYGNCFPFAPEGLQDHIWTRMDSSDWFWQGGEVKNYGSRFSAEQLAWWKVSHRDAGRMATLNLVIDEAGNINPVVAERLVNAKTIGKVWSQGRYDPTKWQAAPASSNLIRGITAEHEGDRSQYTDGFHRTPTTVLTDGTVPMSEPVAGANLTNGEKAQIFESLNGNVFTWTLAETSDIYGFNLYSRSTRSNNNGGKDGGNDAIVVSSIEVLPAGGSDWVSIGAPALSFGIQDGISGGALVARLADDSGAALATNVAKIRFTQGSPENGASLLVECEVIGCKSAPQVVDIPTAAAALLPGYWLAAPLTGDPSDFITEGTVALHNNNANKPLAGAKSYGCDDTVNNINFGGSNSAEGHMTGNPTVGSNKDSLSKCGLSGKYGDILNVGWSGSTVDHQVFNFSGLDTTKTYLVQYIIHNGKDLNRYAEVTDAVGTHRVWLGAEDAGDEWYYGGTLVHVFQPDASGAYSLSIDYRKGDDSNNESLMNAYQIREVTREVPDPPVPPPVYRLTIPAKTGLVLGSVTTNGTPVAETEGVYSVVSNTEVTITFTAASGYELDGNDGVVVKTIESDTTLADADYPAVKEQGGGGEDPDKPVDPQPGELVNGRAEMKGWSMKRISTPAAAPSVSSPQGWSGQSITGLYTSDPSDKYSSLSATEGEITMTFGEAVVANTIQLFAPKENVNCMASAFKVYGSSDGSSWTELLSVTGEADWFARECRYYTFKNETAYTQYKLAITSVAGGSSLKLGVFNYFFAKPADPTTPWVWDPNSKAAGFNDNGKLWRGDQQLSAWKNGNRIQLRNNSSNVNAYDLDFSAGLVDVDGNPLSYTVYLENGIKSSKLLTRIIGAAVVDAVPGWGAQYCWYLNELSLGSAFTSFGEKQAFENAYSLQCLDLTQLSAQTLPIGTFNSAYNLKGDIVLKVKTFAASFARSHITSLILNEVETYGDGNSYFDPFGWCDCLTNVTLGAGLKDINCGRAFGKVGKDGSPAYVDIWWKGAPPTFTRSQPELFNEGANNRITHHLPWSQREAWIDFAANHGLTSFSLTLPEGLASADGIWESNIGVKSIVKWWNDAPPAPKGLILMIR